MTPIRPKFSNPPLIERALSVAFSPIDGFSVADYGLFWTAIRAEFPVVETRDPVQNLVERFDRFPSVEPGLQIIEGHPLPRALYSNPEAGELVQVQPDRFSFNWLKAGDEHRYPHSEATLTRFTELFGRFKAFLASRSLAQPVVIQCEITNVNIVPISDVGESFADMATVLKFAPLGEICPEVKLEHQMVASKHFMLDDSGQPFGRVHAIAQPSMSVPANDLVYRFDIAARGVPIGSSVDPISAFFERAASAINGVFLASVTKAGRQFWGEYNG